MPNKTIYKDLLKTQYYFLFNIFVVCMLINGICNQSYSLRGYDIYSQDLTYTYEDISETIAVTSIWIMLVAIGLVLFQIHWLRSRMGFYASLPVKKINIVNSHYLAGFTLLICGYLVHFGCIAFFNTMKQNSDTGYHNIGFWFVPVVTGGLIMVCTYTLFFFIGLLHNNSKGLAWTMLIFLSLTGSEVIIMNPDDMIGTNVFRWVWDLTRPDNYVKTDNFDSLFQFDSILLIIIIVFCFCQIQCMSRKIDMISRKGVFSLEPPKWGWGLIGAVIGYAVVRVGGSLSIYIVYCIIGFLLHNFEMADKIAGTAYAFNGNFSVVGGVVFASYLTIIKNRNLKKKEGDVA